MQERKCISIVVPCYNEEEVILKTLHELRGLFDSAPDYDFEAILVDDGSSDGTLALLRQASKFDDRIGIIVFARNFGHQIAITAGIDAASGDAVVLIDADLQDPPQVILEMIAKWREGYDVVYGVRRSREGESSFKRATALAFYRVLNGLSEVPIPLDTGDFRLMSRQVVDVLRQMPEKHRFVRGLVAWVGFRQFALPYDRHKRAAGVTKYPLRKMISFASDGILSFSSRPLQLATSIGLTASVLALLGIVYAVVLRVFTSLWVEGWTALIIAVLFMGGAQLICLGVIGEYLARVYEQSKSRPLYVVRDRIKATRRTEAEPSTQLAQES